MSKTMEMEYIGKGNDQPRAKTQWKSKQSRLCAFFIHVDQLVSPQIVSLLTINNYEIGKFYSKPTCQVYQLCFSFCFKHFFIWIKCKLNKSFKHFLFTVTNTFRYWVIKC